jgi:hypothetical protein
MKKSYWFGIMFLLAALAFSLSGAALAAPDAPPTPSSFYGEIHVSSGDGVPLAGDYVEAWVPGVSNYVSRSAITTYGGNLVYSINVLGDDPDVSGKDGGVENDIVTFKVNGRVMATGVWHGGTNVLLNFHPPKSIPGGPYTGNTNSPIDLSGASDDFGADVSAYLWSNGAGLNEPGQNYTFTQYCPEYTTCGGDATWYLKVTDAQGGEGRTNFHVIVNNTPWAYDQSVTTNEDTAKAITLTGFDPENGYNITYEIVTGPAHGALSGTPPNVTYTPAADYAGADSFTFHTIDDKNAASPTHTVSITVTAINDAPVLTSIGSKSVNELVQLSFTASATDVDLPGDTLIFSLADGSGGSVPSGAAITTGGAFTWTPTELQGPGSSTFDVCVSDEALSDCETITVTVNEVNLAPVLNAIGNQSVDELVLLSFTATATDSDKPDNTLTFSLADGSGGSVPGGATITTGGAFTWTPTELQGPGPYTFDVCVSDGTVPDCETITVTVNEVNLAPVLNAIGNQSVDELVLLSLTATATDSDKPDNTLTFSLADGSGGSVPSGAAITTGGAFTWTPTELQGPNSYTFDVCVSDGTVSDCETITVTVNEVNVAPTLNAIGPKVVNELVLLSFTATASDADLPGNSLAFSLVGAPSGAAITSGGAFTWTPTRDQGGTDYTFTVKVCDNGSPVLCDEEEITVTVNDTIATHSISLVVGWNLVSFNLQPYPSTATLDVLATIAGNYDLVYAWDSMNLHPESGNWLRFDPALGYGNTLVSLSETQGFWIHMTTADTLDVQGTRPTTTLVALHGNAGGWNLVGYPSQTSSALPGAIAPISGSVSLIYAYHASDTADPWKIYDPVAPGYANDLAAMAPGYGYWIYIPNTSLVEWYIAY